MDTMADGTHVRRRSKTISKTECTKNINECGAGLGKTENYRLRER